MNVIKLDTCKGCGKTFGIDCDRSNADREYCSSCASSARGRVQQGKRDNEGWLEMALEEGIPLWEQQPNESNEEYSLWVCYMQLWPGVRPTVTRVAEACEVSASTVQRAYNKWTWGARLQAWIREVTAERTAQLRESRRRMVDEHVSMGEAMRAKAMQAIEAFDPYDVTPNELVSILKETQRLESTARDMLDSVEQAVASDVDGYVSVEAPAGLFSEEQPSLSATNHRGLSQQGIREVVDILSAAGVLRTAQDDPVMVVNEEDM